MTAADQAGAARESFPWGLVLALAVAQLAAWGTLYYAFAIVMAPMGAELGWSKAAMNGALSVGLGVTGIAAVGVGRWIDRHGGRMLMTAGSLIGAALLILWSQVTALWHLYAIWVGIGLVSATVLYEPVFAVVARVLPNEYRRAITTITLLGGLASTVFIPLTQGLVDVLGWRHALLVLAAIELPLCAGIPWLLLRGRETRPTAATISATKPGTDVVRRAMAHPTFWFLVATFVCTALLHTALLFNLVPMLEEQGLTIGEAVAVYAVIGPSQVAGRIALLTLERSVTVSIAGIVGAGLPVIAMVVLGLSQADALLACGFAIAFGAGMGIKTIVQATAAPEFLGREGYGALQGAIVMPVYAAQAIAPFAAAMIWQIGGGYKLLEVVLLLIAIMSVVAFALAALLAPKIQTKGRPTG
jgi:MFS family permease